MKRKSYGIYICLLCLLAAACWSMAGASADLDYIRAAGQQSLYKLTVTTSRGMIYDCNMNPLVNRTSETVAAVPPSVEAMAQLNADAGETDRRLFAAHLESGTPFLYEVDAKKKYEDLDVFEVPRRYAEDQLASHVIGYTDSMGNGVTGVEQAMNSVLSRSSGEVAVYYRTDALGRMILGDEREVVDTTERTKAGVVLTLDSMLQAKTEELAQRLGKGSVIVAEVPNCEIRALASVPDFTPAHLDEAAGRTDGPLVNRAFAAYSPGSVFKLVTATDALERNMGGYSYTCTGQTEVSGLTFHCFDGDAHGRVDLTDAIAKSCNGYFIQAGLRQGGTSLLAAASNLGFGKSLSFGAGLEAVSGTLPATTELLNERALANFSFGQGTLTVTPLQIAGLINTIAAGGEYAQPLLIAGTVDDSRQYIAAFSGEKTRVMQESTARTLRTAMEKAVDSGTARHGKPQQVKAGAKTGTAQTGVFTDGGELNHYWYAGYLSDGSGPRYVIVVMREGVVSDDQVTAGIFKELSDFIAAEIF